MRIHAGTSGFSYKEWKGAFYPEDLPQSRFLGYYAGELDTVEINNTFYRMPTEKTLRGWAEQVPDGFTFALKASRKITHKKDLEEIGDPLAYLMATVPTLGDRLGPVLFQLPPYRRKELERLEYILERVPGGVRAAFEFRHESWFDDDVYAALRGHGAALVASQTADIPDPPVVATADFGYMRLRREGYDPAELAGWVERIRGQDWADAFVFFKHEDEGTGPRLARQFLEAAGA